MSKRKRRKVKLTPSNRPFPTCVEVGGQELEVKKVSPDNPKDAGNYLPWEKQILVCPEERDPPMVLLHEIGHAIMKRAGLNNVISDEVEEIVVEAFAIFMRENLW